MNTATTQAKIDYATKLRDRIRDLYAAAAQDPNWATELDRCTDNHVRKILAAATDKYTARKLRPWEQEVVPVNYTPGPDTARAARDAIRPAVIAHREAIRDTTDDEIRSMDRAQLSNWIDTAKTFR